MSQDTKTESFIKALENYFLLEQNPGLRQKNHISKLLNTTTEPIDKIQERFNFFFSYTGSSRVKKYLDLLEYLSIHSTDKLLDVITTEKFIETVTSVLMEPEFQDTVCKIFRLWFDKYEMERTRAARILEMIGNLEFFGITIPISYKSKYEGIDVEAEIAKLPPEKTEEKQGDKYPKVDISDRSAAEAFLAKADVARNRAHVLLVSQNSAPMSDMMKKETIQGIYEEIKKLLAYVIPKTNTLDAENRESVENAMSELKRFSDELKEEGGIKEDTERTNTQYGPQRIYGPEPRPAEGRERTKDDDTRQFAHMLSPDELMSYKLHPCEDQMRCKHAPTSRKGFQIGSLSKEILCSGWHGMQDRRRAVLDEKGNTLYKFSLCNRKDECRSGDNCKKAHNFFEAFFHPMNYKSKRCALVTVCKYGKYCPYFHSTDEKEQWTRILKERFNFKSEETYAEEHDIWGEDTSSNNIAYAYENVMKHLPPGAAIPMGDIDRSQNQKYDYTEKRYNEVKTEVQDVRSDKPKDKELVSTLTIRKKYVEASKLTTVLYSSPCFYAVPFSMLGTQDVKEKYVPGKEQNNVAVLENGKQVHQICKLLSIYEFYVR